MKNALRTLFSPLLAKFEAGEGEYKYEKSHRSVLLGVGVLFGVLTTSVIAAGVYFSELGFILPALIFVGLSITCLVVGGLGTDRAVANIWNTK
jgi:hypothetical protein